jgi:hypothetical protein
MTENVLKRVQKVAEAALKSSDRKVKIEAMLLCSEISSACPVCRYDPAVKKWLCFAVDSVTAIGLQLANQVTDF